MTVTLLRKPRREKPAEPVHGVCRWINRPQFPYGLGRLAINGVEYDTECHVVNEGIVGVRLVKDDDTAYDIDAGGEFFQCDCPDGTYRPNRPSGCKHVRALQVAGLLPAAPVVVLDRMRRALPQDHSNPPVSGDLPATATPAGRMGFRSLGDQCRNAPELVACECDHRDPADLDAF